MALWNGLALCINGFMETALFRLRMYFSCKKTNFRFFLQDFHIMAIILLVSYVSNDGIVFCGSTVFIDVDFMSF